MPKGNKVSGERSRKKTLKTIAFIGGLVGVCGLAYAVWKGLNGDFDVSYDEGISNCA